MQLANDGHQIHALYRTEGKASVIKHPNIKLFKGDILDYESLAAAIEGCTQIYHTAAFAKVWHKDISSIYRLNTEGTANVIRAGIHAGVKKIVCTSTAGVFGPSEPGKMVDENTPRPLRYFLDYECSKSIMEETLKTYAASGIDVVTVNPTRVFGPGVLSDSNGVTRMIQSYIAGKWRIIPGNGKSIGNYVFVDDVVLGHILAMEKGKAGERYVLGGSNMTYDEFFKELSDLTGKSHTMIHLPIPVMMMISKMMLFVAKISGSAPLITPSLVRKYNHNWNVANAKALNELNYEPVDFKTGAGLTIDWLKNLK